MKPKLNYSLPTITFNQKLQGANRYPRFNEKEKSFEDYKERIFGERLTLVTSKPGMGKSRFLHELFNAAKESSTEACFLDLKGIRKSKLLDALNDFSGKWREDLSSKYYTQTQGFNPSDEKTKVFCLDALDECPTEGQGRIIEEILQICSYRENDIFILSCRDAIVKQHEIDLNNFKALYAQIQPFHEGNVIGILRREGLSADQCGQIWDKFRRGWRFQGLSSPRHVEAFLQLVNTIGFDETITKSVGEIYNTLISHQLKEEGSKTGENHGAITQRLLEKLALTMEVLGENHISEDELMTFFEEVDSSIGNTFLQQVKLESLYQRALLDYNSFSDSIQFLDTEIQEYLAAKAISRFANPKQGVFDLIFDLELKEFKPSWTNTVKYICGLMPDLILPITDFIVKRGNMIDSDLLEAILSADWGVLNKLSKFDRHEVFTKTIDYYYLNEEYVFQELEGQLARYFIPDLANEFLIHHYEQNGSTINCVIPNIYRFIGSCQESEKDGLLGEKWVELAKIEVLNTEQRDLIRRTALELLAVFGEFEWLKDQEDLMLESSRSVQEEWVRSLHDADPNNMFSIQKAIEAERSRLYSYSPHPNPLNVSTKQGLINCLELINSDVQMAQDIAYQEKYSLDRIVKLCSTHWDNEVQEKIISIINSQSTFRLDKGLNDLYGIIREKKPKYCFDYAVKNASKLDTDKLFNLLTIQYAISIIEHFNSNKLPLEPLFHVFYRYRNYDDDRSKALFKIGQDHFSRDFVKIEKKWLKHQAELEDREYNKNTYQNFKTLLGQNDASFDHRVFLFFNLHESSIRKKWTESDQQQYRQAITSALSEDVSINPFKRLEDGRPSKNQKLNGFNNALDSAKRINYDFSVHRENIIKAIPILLGEDKVMERVAPLFPMQKEEVDIVVKFYKENQHNDIIAKGVDNLRAFVEQFEPEELLPIIKSIVTNHSFHKYDRLKFLDLIHKISSDVGFYHGTFNSISDNFDPIKEKCNALLIEYSPAHRQDAITWRMEQVKQRVKKYGPNLVRTLDYQEPEYDQNRFNKPLKKVNDESVLDLYFDLLEFSIALYEKGESFYPYCDYIWITVFDYLSHVAKHKSLSTFKQAEKIVKPTKAFSENRFLQSHFKSTKKQYVLEVSKPENILTAIMHMNELRKKSFMRIQSSSELLSVVEDVIETDLRSWVEIEGAYRFIAEAKGQQEDLIQKTIKSELQLALIKRGFRQNELRIIREEQLLDGLRIDFSIVHGFVGKVFVELKRTDNPDLANETEQAVYKDKMMRYLGGSHSDFGIFLLLQIKSDFPIEYYKPKLQMIYADTEIVIHGLNCLGTD